MNKVKSQSSLWVSFWIALRYLRSRNQSKSFSLGAIVSVMGLAIGVAALTVTLGILSGFSKEYKRSILGLGAHGVVLSSGGPLGFSGEKQQREIEEKLRSVKDVLGVHPFVLGEGMLGYGGRVKGALIKGIDPTRSRSVTDLEPLLIPRGSLQWILNDQEIDSTIIGKDLAQMLGVSIGDLIQLIILSEEKIPQIFPLKVKALFRSGMYEYDSRIAYVRLPAAQRIFLKPGEITGMEISIKDPEMIDRMGTRIKNELSYPLYLLKWKDLNANLFAALKLEKIVFFLLILPIVFVGALTVIAALIMFMIERQKSISILKTMGMNRLRIGFIFILQGMMIGVIGLLFGFFLGFLITFLLSHFPIIKLSPQVYFIDHLPISIRFTDYLLISVTALFLCFIATLLPSFKAATLKPVEGIRGK
jgi:lipoprotein-releasing system permease protein